MSFIAVLSSARAFARPMLVKPFSMSLACAAVIVCCAVYDATSAASAMQAAPAAVKGAFMTFAVGSDAEPPPWPENVAGTENAPVVVASAAPASGVRFLPGVQRLVPHAVSLGTERDGTAMAIVWNR
ncbi:MAG: hypothetical protein ACAH83_01965 [Alphaproteobacteria bacterium]